MRPAGYLIHGAEAGRGAGYTYVMAGNGLFLEAENPLITARLHLAEALVRGLEPLGELLELRHGRVPGHLLSLVMDVMTTDREREMYAAIVWDGGYRIVLPPQEAGPTHVTYETVPETVVNIHSHGRMEAFFSSADDADDQGFTVSVVVGRLDSLFPEVKSRLCVYGYFAPIRMRQIFDQFRGVEIWNTDL